MTDGVNQTAAQYMANIVRESAKDDEVAFVVDAIDVAVRSDRARNGAAINACAQVLAQCITKAAQIGAAAEMRAALISLIDGFAMQSAIEESDNVS